MAKRSRHGRAEDEAAWRSAEVDVIYRLRDAGVRVPRPYNFYDGVLVMELVTGVDGQPAPRLGDISFSPAGAREVYDRVLQEVVRMLCAGVVHGDLSEFNVLMSADGPVIIDFPQAVDPASNSSARALLLRDVDNFHRFLSRVVRHRAAPLAQEMWGLFERNELSPDTELKGNFRDTRRKANTKDVLDLIGDAARDEERRRQREQEQKQGQGGRPGRSGRSGRANTGAAQAQQVQVLVRSSEGRARVIEPGGRPAVKPAASPPTKTAASPPAKPPGNGADPAPKKRRRRRRRPRSDQAQAPENG
jgi:RIO kinase 1